MQKDNNTGNPLKMGHFLGLKFDEGWWFTRILERQYTELKPWILLNENGNREPIAPQTAGSEHEEIQTPSGSHILNPDQSDQNLIFQVQVGLAPSRTVVYPIFGRDRHPNLERMDEPGENMVPVTGYDSPYNNPSTQLELFNIHGTERTSLQPYNPTDESLEAKASFHVNKMRYATVTDKGLMKAMIQGQQPAKLYQMGLGVENNEQMTTPGWLADMFGDHIYTTEELLKYDGKAKSQDQNQEGIGLPTQRGGR